jgi:hypothetical protein
MSSLQAPEVRFRRQLAVGRRRHSARHEAALGEHSWIEVPAGLAGRIGCAAQTSRSPHERCEQPHPRSEVQAQTPARCPGAEELLCRGRWPMLTVPLVSHRPSIDARGHHVPAITGRGPGRPGRWSCCPRSPDKSLNSRRRCSSYADSGLARSTSVRLMRLFRLRRDPTR